jgi:lipoprotein-anchoring transpeptidase ErfK/SrfK
VAGTWVRSGSDSLVYDLSAPLVPSSTEVVTIPGGSHGLKAANGKTLSAPNSFSFTVANGDTLRLQQLLAELDYLPLSFTPSGPAPAPQDLAQDEAGSFAWKWATLPTELTSLWTQGLDNQISKAAVENFENQNNLTVDGEAGPAVWAALLHDATAKIMNANPYVYVLVNKVQPENLTLWENGTAQLSDILVNTGAEGADTVDGTYAVFEHVRYSDMKGTNPDGTKYNDPNVPYASYFNGGDALHGFIRASYGYPQSNGCVEMSYANAALVWPLTPIGTIVTVEGPASPPLPTTTTTTAPPATTTTTTAAPPATATTAPPATPATTTPTSAP